MSDFTYQNYLKPQLPLPHQGSFGVPFVNNPSQLCTNITFSTSFTVYNRTEFHRI